jgi:hypothetical protein
MEGIACLLLVFKKAAETVWEFIQAQGTGKLSGSQSL